MANRSLKGIQAVFAVIAAAFLPSQTSAAEVPEAWAWKHRLIVVFAPHVEDTDLIAQRSEFARYQKGFEERHLILLEVVSEAVNTSIGPDLNVSGPDLRDYARKTGEHFEIMLFGKDTGIKLRSAKPVSANEVFALIDQMPMRRDEMRRQEN
ncbi:DUF4174 domain-containing protein [Roseibium porphyridii]|uniref:DUF4174 domain-containing protein n=1 Tax=Roseibium porphyridii TaxID=2866279 RepID=A0ABY8F599_9HYPH|nr:DUF4174 domain-containing protein [Roseibium sp. KMA01]WFE89619.1 DUF4174 domain-containing protein [Roseibium sp. KMA01]